MRDYRPDPKDAERFTILYPERRSVTASQIKGWYADALANNELAAEYRDATDVRRMAAALDDAGIITVGREQS